MDEKFKLAANLEVWSNRIRPGLYPGHRSVQAQDGLHHASLPALSRSNPKKTYVGMTQDVNARLQKHNAGGSPHTARHQPWELVASIGVKDKQKAAELERYFKTGSGHAFAHKHLW